MFGEEVDDDETVPAHLERLLPSTEVLNFGVHGYGVGQMGMLLESRIDEFNPNHVVLMILIPEDIARDSSDFLGHAKPSFALSADGRVEVRNTPVPEATRQPWIFRNCYSAAWLFGRARALETSPNLGQQMQMLHGMLAQMKSKCEKMGAGFTVVPIVVAGSIERARREPSHRQAVEVIRTSLQTSGFQILDLVGPLAESYAREGEKLVAPVAHWSSRGNCLIAMRGRVSCKEIVGLFWRSSRRRLRERTMNGARSVVQTNGLNKSPSADRGTQGDWAKRVLAGSLIAALILVAYRNVYSVPFLFDDFAAIVENPHIHQVWPPTWLTATQPQTPLTGRPFAALTFALNWKFAGGNPTSYHAVNVAIHCMCAGSCFAWWK
ncbi:MAG: hypothetical protein IPK83_15080 [Planctomycetes bacterium]|nr:hypothetical protein [Planctomycetota bacterium]